MKLRVAQIGDGVVRFLEWFFSRDWAPVVFVGLFGLGFVAHYGGIIVVLQLLGGIFGVAVAVGGPIWFLVWSHNFMNEVRQEDHDAGRRNA